MGQMLTKLIKTYEFTNNERPFVTLGSDKVRLNSEDEKNSRIQLVDDNGYPTDDDLFVKTKLQQPNALLKWLMFETMWTTNEPDFVEYPMTLSNKVGNTFDFSCQSQIPKVGDHVYQGDIRTTIGTIVGTSLTLTDGTGFVDGLVYSNRTQCDVLVRLYDKDENMWVYDIGTSSWVIGTSTDWNTMYVVNTHIPELDIKTIGKGLGFYINLKTADPRYTPAVFYLQVLFSLDIEFTEDLIFDSVIPAMENGLVVTTQVNIKLVEDTDTIDLANTYVMENDGYNITGVEVVYNRTQDPTLVDNIGTGYTLGTPRRGGGHDAGVVQLNGIQNKDDVLEMKLTYFPEIAVSTSKDYYEVSKHPLIVFEHIEKKSITTSPSSTINQNHIRNKLTLTGVKVDTPEQYNLIFEYACFTDRQSDQHRLGEALHRFFNAINSISSWGLDEPYPVIVSGIFRSENKPNLSDINTHVGQFKLANVVDAVREPVEVELVEYLVRGMSTN